MAKGKKIFGALSKKLQETASETVAATFEDKGKGDEHLDSPVNNSTLVTKRTIREVGGAKWLILEEDEYTGKTMAVGTIPEMKKTWVCDYHYPMRYRGMLILIALILTAPILMSIYMFSRGSIVYMISSVVTIIMCLILQISFIFRSFNLALYKTPIPPINVFGLSEIIFSTIFNTSDEEELEKEGVDGEDIRYLTNTVSRYNGENPSPATYLSNWLEENGYDQEDLEEATGGYIDAQRFVFLMKDSASEWQKKKTLKVLSKATNSTIDQWEDAYNKYHIK